MPLRLKSAGEIARLMTQPPAELALAIQEPPRKKPSQEDNFAFQIRAFQLPTAIRNYRFAKEIGRQWRFDFAFLEHKCAVEIEGLVVRMISGQLVCQGRHATVTGFREDCAKYANAALMGWTVLRFERDQVKSGYAREMTMRVLVARGWQQP